MTEKREKDRPEDLTLDRGTFEESVRQIWHAEPLPKQQRDETLNLSHLTPEEIAQAVLTTPPPRSEPRD